MAYRRPRVDTTASEAFTGLIGLVAQLIDKDLDRKEKSKTEKIVMLGELHRAAERKLAKTKEDYTTSSTAYKILLGEVSPVDITDTVEIQKNLLDWYQLDTKGINQNIAAYETEIKNQLTEIANIQRLQKGLGSTAVVTYERGDPKTYDMADLEAGRLAETFNIPKETIAKWMETQPEQIPGYLRSLEQQRKVAVEESLKEIETKKGRKQVSTSQLVENISEWVANSRYFQDLKTTAANKDASQSEKLLLMTGLSGGQNVRVIDFLAPELAVNKGDTKKVKKYKEAEQMRRIGYLHNTFKSFATKGAIKDVRGLGNFVNRLETVYKEIPSEGRPGFKKYVLGYFNIDLDELDKFILPSYTLGERGLDRPVTEYTNMTPEENIIYDFELSKLSPTEYMASKSTREQINTALRLAYPRDKENMSLQVYDEIILNKAIDISNKIHGGT